MQYKIFLQTKSPQNFVASVVGMSNLVAQGRTEEEALSNIKTILETTLSQGKLLDIEVQEPEKLPQMKFAGIFAEDKTFGDFMEKLKLIRQKANEES